MTTTIDLGDKVRDKITGFEGVATGRAHYITGCTQYAVTGSHLKPDQEVAYHWFDEVRLEIVQAKAISLSPPATAPGGPSIGPPSQHRAPLR